MNARCALLSLLLGGMSLTAQQPFKEGWVLPPVGQWGRMPVPQDALEEQLAAGTFTPGEPLLASGEEKAWSKVVARESVQTGPSGANRDHPWTFVHDDLRGGWLHCTLTSEQNRTALLYAAGHRMIYVNGEPVMGDPSVYGFHPDREVIPYPVRLREGENHFLFHGCAQALQARLEAPPSRAMLRFVNPEEWEYTLPDVIAGEEFEGEGAVEVYSLLADPLRGAAIRAVVGMATAHTPVPDLLPCSVTKVGFRIKTPSSLQQGEAQLTLVLLHGGAVLSTAEATLRVVGPRDRRRVTFRSRIDDTVQFYHLLPATGGGKALVLALHGASVQTRHMAGSYRQLEWAHIAVPTNRRPYGFDWEDWGRLDALEVLEHSSRLVGADPRRVFVTGHSMGGHGTWHLGVLYPDRWAGIGPSAAWASFTTDGRASPSPRPVEELIRRAAGPSDTLALARNLLQLPGIAILHGENDQNVPLNEARTMRRRLDRLGYPEARVLWHTEPPEFGGHNNHQWGRNPAKALDGKLIGGSMDWPPMWEFFRDLQTPEPSQIAKVDVTTFNPGISPGCHWVRIESQVQMHATSRAAITLDREHRRFEGMTENVSRLSLDCSSLPPDRVEVVLDGQKVVVRRDAGSIHLIREKEGWAPSAPPPAGNKGPLRYGPFKEAFGNRALLVYGTQGSAEENAWSLAKARFDQQQWWYLGNGSFPAVADTDFDPAADQSRNVILYGNDRTNGAWKAMIPDAPLTTTAEGAAFNGQPLEGSLAFLLLRPRKEDNRAYVAAIGGSDVTGMRLTNRVGIFSSGVQWPDVMIWDAEALRSGPAAIRYAGYFGPSWDVGSGEFRKRQ